MKWVDEYAIGVQQIDEQHKMIIDTADDYRSALDAGDGEGTYKLLLDFLARYIRVHFGFEERCMTEYRCPAAEKNREAHREFTRTISDFERRYAEGGYRASDARELVDTLDRWFAEHILSIDANLKQYVGQ